MIQRGISLEHRLTREIVRHAGSLATLVYYQGTMPASCDASADGERVASLSPMSETAVRSLAEGHEPTLADGANYWRLLDNGGLVVMQGDGKP
jgi:hypothetical protein